MATVRYSIEGNRVFYTHHYTGRQELHGADASTFVPLQDPIVEGTNREDWHFAGKDRASVWFMTRRIEEADASSFRYFHGGQCKWGADQSHVFALYVSDKPRAKVAKSKVSQSLHFLDEPFGAYMRTYALTEQRVYYYGRWVRGADPKTFRTILVDRSGQPPGRSGVYRDDRFAYYYGRKLAEIDPDALIIFQPASSNRRYATDREQVYSVGSTTRTPGRDISGTPMTRITHAEVRAEPRYQPVRDYLARRTDLTDYWFSR